MDTIKNFLLKSLYGTVGAIAGALIYTAGNFKPDGDSITLYIWNTVIVGLMTGAAATLKRWLTPQKR